MVLWRIGVACHSHILGINNLKNMFGSRQADTLNEDSVQRIQHVISHILPQTIQIQFERSYDLHNYPSAYSRLLRAEH